MKVFGIGLNKTGTTSLGRALEILGFNNHVSYNLDLVKHWKLGNFNPIYKVADENNNFEDWPWPLLYKEFFTRYKDAKFILTTRKSPEIWYESLCKHAERTGPTKFRKYIYGYSMPHEHKESHIKFYKDHIKSVNHFFQQKKSKNLITVCWEDGDSWEILSEFLGKKLPKNESFPFLNKAPKI